MVDAALISSGRSEPAKALVTGASGFIGTRLVQRLNRQGVRVTAPDIQPPRERLGGVAYETWDVREPAPTGLGDGISQIYNFAAVHRTPGHPTHDYYETNVSGANHVVLLAEQAGVHDLVFTSSISVYGPSESLLTENAPLKPISAYGRSKRLAEAIHDAWLQRGTERRLVVVRPGVVFGPGERGNYTYLARALSRGVFFYPGRRSTIKSGGYVDELLSAIDFALAQRDRKVVFNFAYPDHSTTADIVAAFAEVCGFKQRHATLPVAPLYAAACLFEAANRIGIANPIHRERILKLVRSTRVEPEWLKDRGYPFGTDLRRALAAWRDETGGTFV